MTEFKIPKSIRAYADIRTEKSQGERFYIDDGSLSRHLRIFRSGSLCRVATKDGFLSNNDWSGLSARQNKFSKFIQSILEKESSTLDSSNIVNGDEEFSVPRNLIEMGQEFSEKVGLRYTWEKKAIRFLSNFAGEKHKIEKMKLVRADAKFKIKNHSLHVRKFIYDPSVEGLKNALTKLTSLSKDLKGARAIKPLRNAKVILHPSLASVWLHEVVGHWIEILSGKLMVKSWIGQRICEQDLTVRDTPVANEQFQFLFDEEGINSREIVLIDKGIFHEPYLTLWSAYQSQFSKVNGHARAQDFKFQPTARMMNIVMNPGSVSIEDMLHEVNDGYILYGSLGGIREPNHYQVQSQYGYKIEKGKLSYPIFGPLILGNNGTALRSLRCIGQDYQFVFDGGCLSGGQFLERSGRGAPYILLEDIDLL
ncbi:MAG: hypothetical protein KDD48_00175 [Bdellovibrionales bacterium]|nr:hypothetical protein [Bdellovibrionales bacterium]